MDVIYTVVPIGGLVEHSHPPVATRVARERLVAIMEETFLHHRYITSYTVIGDREFPYPFETPDVLKTQSFFQTDDLNAIKRELEYLYTESVREKREAYLAASEAAKVASDEEMLALYDKYHYSDERKRRDHAEAMEKIEGLWGTWDEVKDALTGGDRGYSARRSDLLRALAALDECLVRAYLEDREELQAHLAAGERGEAAKRIESLAHDWCRKHVSKFENCCGDEKFYGAGYWLARMVVNPDWVAKDTNTWGGKEPDVEQVLNQWEMPFFRVPGDIIARGTTEDSAVVPA